MAEKPSVVSWEADARVDANLALEVIAQHQVFNLTVNRCSLTFLVATKELVGETNKRPF